MCEQTKPKLKWSQVHMEDINSIASAWLDVLTERVEFDEEEQDKLYEDLVAKLEGYFNYPDYRRYL